MQGGAERWKAVDKKQKTIGVRDVGMSEDGIVGVPQAKDGKPQGTTKQGRLACGINRIEAAVKERASDDDGDGVAEGEHDVSKGQSFLVHSSGLSLVWVESSATWLGNDRGCR
ncbi:hypothetical protein E0Z10_g9745 [Xylaria hypoxylon]|uniref:Uncharacterized protein n=1 Tax=Xylaria hypoxylon TaxID=37992 RepID=A0A4Z0Y5F7_9PEZI|nr:hypothetical protein E0Z10_g9745 [Xylaria hypoxylon]